MKNIYTYIYIYILSPPVQKTKLKTNEAYNARKLVRLKDEDESVGAAEVS
jgi:hypothetical protein